MHPLPTAACRIRPTQSSVLPASRGPLHAYLGARATSERSIGRPGWMGGRQIKSNAIVVSREGNARLTPSPPSLNMRKMPPAKEKGCNATATKTSSAQHKLTKRTLSFGDRAGTPTLTPCITTPIDRGCYHGGLY